MSIFDSLRTNVEKMKKKRGVDRLIIVIPGFASSILKEKMGDGIPFLKSYLHYVGSMEET